MWLICWFTRFSNLRCKKIILHKLSYFIDLQGSQTSLSASLFGPWLSYFTDLQGSQTLVAL